MFKPAQKKRGKSGGMLSVHVKSAKGLPNMDEIGYTDGFVKLALLPDRKKRQKTKVIGNDLNPVWNEKFTFDVSFDELCSKRVLELTVWDHDMFSSNDFVGGIRLGPSLTMAERSEEWMDSSQKEAAHWKKMLTQQGEWVEYCHSLRASMVPREFDDSVTSSAVSSQQNGSVEAKKDSKKEVSHQSHVNIVEKHTNTKSGSLEGDGDDQFFLRRVHFMSCVDPTHACTDVPFSFFPCPDGLTLPYI